MLFIYYMLHVWLVKPVTLILPHIPRCSNVRLSLKCSPCFHQRGGTFKPCDISWTETWLPVCLGTGIPVHHTSAWHRNLSKYQISFLDFILKRLRGMSGWFQENHIEIFCRNVGMELELSSVSRFVRRISLAQSGFLLPVGIWNARRRWR